MADHARLRESFAAARRRDAALLCPFFTAGYPDIPAGIELLLAAQETGCGCVEWGIPFSDPVADGPVVQESYTAVLQAGTTVAESLAAIGTARKAGLTIPVAAMVSYSLVFRRGPAAFFRDCASHGIDALIIPDLSLEEAPAVCAEAALAGLAMCPLISPTSPPARREAIARVCTGFIYYLSLSGITGERSALPADLAANVAGLKAMTDVPVVVGFGISNVEQVRMVSRAADGVIIGSAIIRRVGEKKGQPTAAVVGGVRDFLTAMVAGTTRDRSSTG